ncbi:MAG: flavoprotein, partial [Candidatus Hodarchaeota archaeon]
MKPKKIAVGLTGASGIQYGIEVIKALVENKIETHVIVSKWAEFILQDEVDIE